MKIPIRATSSGQIRFRFYKYVVKIYGCKIEIRARAEITVEIGWLFGRFEDAKISF